MLRLDIAETAPRRASRLLAEFLSSARTLWLVVAVAAGSAIALFWIPSNWSDLWSTVAVLAAGVVLASVVVGVLFLRWLVMSPRLQRDEARARLREIAAAATTYSIVPISATTAPVGADAILRAGIENRGRGALFAVVVESVDGVEDFIDPHTPLYWMGRPGVLDEEIPPTEGRLIGIGRITWFDDGIRLRFLGSDGEAYHRPYQLRQGTTTLWLRISARGVPEIGYSRRFGMQITWDGEAAEYFVALAPDPPDAITQMFAPTIAALLDYGR